MDETTKTAFEAAVGRFLDGEPEPGDAELIARVLRAEPEQARAFTGLLAVDDLLRQSADPQPESFVEAVLARVGAEQTQDRFLDRVDAAIERRQPPRRAAIVWLPWLLTAAALVLALVSWWPRSAARPRPIATAPAAAASRDVLALMVNEAGARFAQGAGPEAVSFGKGEYALTQGAAHLRFRNGADMVVVAPARFTIDNALLVRMTAGSLRVFAPPSAHGFVIAAPGVRYRDLGTEFGVAVVPDTGQSKLHVFDGEVQVIRDGDKAPEATITEGQSVKVVKGEVTATDGPAEGQFPTPGEISLRRWQHFQQQLQRDPNLVFYFPFIPAPGDPQLLKDVAERGPHVPGRIDGAQWVAGRWPGKSALQFEHGSDRVALTIPGEYEQLTLAAWIKVDRYENAMNVLLSSAGWGEGGVQWQMNRFGNLGATSVFSQPKRRLLSMQTGVPTGRWVFVAVTIDRATGKILHYINGRLVGEARIAPGTVLRPGTADIGMWEKGNRAPSVRDFRGRMDELEMWRVVLPPARIAELADAGMPIELPAFGNGGAKTAAPR